MNSKVTGSVLLSALIVLVPVFAFTGGATAATVQKRSTSLFVCPMDADVKSSKSGKCPKCGMALRAAETEAPASVESETARANKTDVSGAPQIPDIAVYDQNGRRLRFYSDLVKGKTVAINFVFTTCTTICPPLTATFRKVQQEMRDRIGRDVSLISISVDPATDVPERLKSFAAKFDVGPGWTFVTGNKLEIDQLLRALGASVADKNDHTPMILVGNEAASHWTRTYGLASPATLVKVITEAADNSRGRTELNAGRPSETGLSKTAPSFSNGVKVEDGSSVQVPLPGVKEGPGGNERQVERRMESRPVAPPAKTAAVSGDRAAETKTPAEAAAAYFPNNVLLTQDNKPVRFFDDLLKGKTALINFVFTTCNGVCPPMTANLAKVQDYLGSSVGKEIVMITISVDPTVDTPAALKKYADSFKVKPGWYFLTGKKEDVDQVLKKIGGYVDDKLKHSSVLLIGNLESGEWMKVLAMAKPADIAEAARKVAASKAE